MRVRVPSRGMAVRIGLTPLIDVVFILLVFFMLAARFADWRAIEIAGAGSGVSSSAHARVGALLVEVLPAGTADGAVAYRLSGARVDRDTLVQQVARRLATHPGTAVHVRPVGVAVQPVIDTLEGLSGLGVPEIRLIGGGT